MGAFGDGNNGNLSDLAIDDNCNQNLKSLSNIGGNSSFEINNI